MSRARPRLFPAGGAGRSAGRIKAHPARSSSHWVTAGLTGSASRAMPRLPSLLATPAMSVGQRHWRSATGRPAVIALAQRPPCCRCRHTELASAGTVPDSAGAARFQNTRFAGASSACWPPPLAHQAGGLAAGGDRAGQLTGVATSTSVVGLKPRVGQRIIAQDQAALASGVARHFDGLAAHAGDGVDQGDGHFTSMAVLTRQRRPRPGSPAAARRPRRRGYWSTLPLPARSRTGHLLDPAPGPSALTAAGVEGDAPVSGSRASSVSARCATLAATRRGRCLPSRGDQNEQRAASPSASIRRSRPALRIRTFVALQKPDPCALLRF